MSAAQDPKLSRIPTTSASGGKSETFAITARVWQTAKVITHGNTALQSTVEQKRLQLSRNTDPKKKSQLGQFFTPEATAKFMAGMFPDGNGVCRLLDAGAGIGSLTAAFLDRWKDGGFHFHRVELDAFEIDRALIRHLSRMLDGYGHGVNLLGHIHKEDFIHAAAGSLCGNLFSKPLRPYTHAILNPPYKKINGNSAHRLALRRVGIETVNLYSAFVALAIAQTAPGGQLVAIIPRSFCNGPYYRPFRNFVLKNTAIRQIHLFGSRSRMFKNDAVLQENIIIHLERDGRQRPVTVSTSTDDTFTDFVARKYPFNRIVPPEDGERFIHIPTSPGKNGVDSFPAIRHALADLGIKVSTGPVVDFRMKPHLRELPGPDTVPLLHPAHFTGQSASWPIRNFKKANAIERNADTEKWLYPKGCYCVVRRFSSKEEKRRVVAGVVEPGVLGDAPMLGFENHLNVFHENRRGLPEPLARGLAVFLNTSAVDEHFRRFNGHTQVNATDLRRIKYPDRDNLIRLGVWAMKQGALTQEQIDAGLETLSE